MLGRAVVVAVAAVLVWPAVGNAATCSDYDNQADAQRAADTRDADGDGVYCESLPCPCLRPGQGDTGGGGGESRPAPRPKRKPKPKPKPRKRAQVISARISSVVDGDTVKVRAFGARRDFYTVRLIGIDTPETRKPGTGVECGGRRATASMYELAFPDPVDSDDDGLADEQGDELGRRVTMTTDPTQDTFDAFGRLLAYVTTRTGENLALEQLRAGWAKVYVFEDRFRRFDRFRQAQSRAARRDRGAWGRCGGNFHAEL